MLRTWIANITESSTKNVASFSDWMSRVCQPCRQPQWNQQSPQTKKQGFQFQQKNSMASKSYQTNGCVAKLGICSFTTISWFLSKQISISTNSCSLNSNLAAPAFARNSFILWKSHSIILFLKLMSIAALNPKVVRFTSFLSLPSILVAWHASGYTTVYLASLVVGTGTSIRRKLWRSSRINGRCQHRQREEGGGTAWSWRWRGEGGGN